MLRYRSTGAARCWAITVRAIRARAPVASTRPPTEQKIHAGKKEPKMLYSGACEQPANISAARDKPERGRSAVIRRRSRSVDSVFMSGATLIPGIGRSLKRLCLRYRLSHRVKGESIGLRYRSIPLHQKHVGGCLASNRYVRPIDSTAHFCLNGYRARKNPFPDRYARARCVIFAAAPIREGVAIDCRRDAGNEPEEVSIDRTQRIIECSIFVAASRLLRGANSGAMFR